MQKEHIELINLKINELKQINLNILQDDSYLIISPRQILTGFMFVILVVNL